MTERPSTYDFIAFQFIKGMAESMDLLNQMKDESREVRRWTYRLVGRKEPRTQDEIIADLSSAGEFCDEKNAMRCFWGIPKRHRGTFESMYADTAKEKGKQWRQWVKVGCQWARWFSGKRYGIVIDPAIAAVLKDVEIDLSEIPISIPWNPMLVKNGDEEFLMWEENGVALSCHFAGGGTIPEGYHQQEGADPIVPGDMFITGDSLAGGKKIETDRKSLIAWLCAVSKGEGKEDYFELKIGGGTIALLPRVNAETMMLKHKIASDTEADKGAWVRKGHFRMSKTGPVWIPGAVFRKDQPFVHKVHELKPKGMLPKSQELFRKG